MRPATAAAPTRQKSEPPRVFVVIVGNPAQDEGELEQALADFGSDWSVAWAEDALTALAIAMEQQVDVVVVEERGSSFDGPTLLNQIRVHHPQSVRILLLEEGAEPRAIHALESTHRFLNRPLRADELVDAVESVVELREILDSDELRAAIGRVGVLPPSPTLYLALSRALYDPDATPAQITDLVSQDPAVAAKVLRLCNSAYFAGTRHIADVRSAVIRLGMQTLRRMVLAAELYSGSAPAGIDRAALCVRGLRASQLATRLLGGSSSELAATAALLAEVGMLLPGVRIPSACLAGDPTACQGPHYAEAGAYLLGLWGLPMPIVEAVANHHRPGRIRFRGFWVGGAVHVAHALVAGEPVDEDYLAGVGLAGRLPAWRKLAEELAVAA